MAYHSQVDNDVENEVCKQSDDSARCACRSDTFDNCLCSLQIHTHACTQTDRETDRETDRQTETHTPQTSDVPIAEAMIANSYVRHSNLCWDYTIQQLARLMN